MPENPKTERLWVEGDFLDFFEKCAMIASTIDMY